MASSELGTLYPFVQAFIEHRIAIGRISREASAPRQRSVLIGFSESFGDRKLADLGPKAVERWMREMVDDQLADSTRRLAFSVLGMFMEWMVRKGHIKRDPTIEFDSPRVAEQEPVTCEQEEVVQVWRIAPDARGRLIILLEVQLGLRCVEVSRLTLADVGQRRMRVVGKFGKQRYVGYASIPEVRKALNDYLAVRGPKPGPLIQSYTRPGRGLTPQTISQMVIRWMYQAGVKERARDGKGGHALRRTMASDLQDRGVDAAVGSKIIGHSDLSSWNRYARVRTDVMDDALAGRVYTRPVGRIRAVEDAG